VGIRTFIGEREQDTFPFSIRRAIARFFVPIFAEGGGLMGARGPAPKPTALKLLEGNPGKQKLNRGEPMPDSPATIPKPPKRLLPEAKKEWKRLAPAMVALGLLTEVDTSAFAELCQNYAYYLAADKAILEMGTQGPIEMQKAPSGYMQQHPLLSLRKQYYETWRKGLADFGLTPASRARISLEDTGGGGTVKNMNDPMERLLAGGW
jgi:P27 family predicted phage terminase small subunit